MKKIVTILLLFLLISVPFKVLAQDSGPIAVLEYYEDDLALEITDASGNPVTDIYYGMELQPGDTIRTNGTVAELKLDPNGSIIKLAVDTVFTIEHLQSSDKDSNDFKLAAGKIHAIAARAGILNRYKVKTPSAVAGVRGTDFGVISYPGSEEKAFVLDGLIDYTKASTGETVSLGKGMIADALSDVFKAVAASQEQLNELVKDVVFTKLDPTKVPGHEAVPGKEESKKEKPTPPVEPASKAGKAEEPKKPTKEDVKKQAENNLMASIAKYLGLEIGTVTVDGETWSKAVIQPTFNLGKLKLSLYLPVIYKTDLFDPEDWYKPEGNNEWSFGTDQTKDDYGAIASDFITDLFLKIRYIEWGKQRDPFFFKVGNLNDMTLGHGLIMKDFANDADFPTVRRVGLNMGIEGKKVGLETVANDLANPEIFGARFYVKPFWKLALGLSGVVDINPEELESGWSKDGTKFLSTGADIDLPIFENDLLSFILFSDVAGMIPYQNGGFKTASLYNKDTGTFRNYGWNAGVFGNILFIDYNLEYRYFDGIFKPAFFDTSYERMRSVRVSEINDYLADTNNPDYTERKTMGIYGEAGFGMEDMFSVKLGYMWPWAEGKDFMDLEDELLLKLEIMPDTIPVLGIYGSVSYQRTGFIQTLAYNNGSATLFDANTVVSGELVYPVAPMLNLAAVFSTSIVTDVNGNVEYENGLPKVAPSITLETRLGY